MADFNRDETLEDLQLKGLRILQKREGFRFGMEAVLLADFAGIGRNSRVADLGSGNGILPLLLWGRDKGREYYALEARGESADLAERNAALNGLENRIHVYHCDVSRAGDIPEARGVDAVVCNPPWEQPGTGPVNDRPALSQARHQQEDTLQRFFRAAYSLLRPRGRLYVVYPAAGILTLFLALRKERLEPKKYRLVYPTAEHPARMVLTEAVRDGKPGLSPMKPLLIQTSEGLLTNELKSIYHMNEQTKVSFESEAGNEG